MYIYVQRCKETWGKSVPSAFPNQVKQAQVCWKVPRFPRLPFQARLAWGSTSQNTSVPPSAHGDTTGFEIFSSQFWADQEPGRGEESSHLSGVTLQWGHQRLLFPWGGYRETQGWGGAGGDISGHSEMPFFRGKKEHFHCFPGIQSFSHRAGTAADWGWSFIPLTPWAAEVSQVNPPQNCSTLGRLDLFGTKRRTHRWFFLFCSLHQWWQTSLLRWSVRV